VNCSRSKKMIFDIYLQHLQLIRKSLFSSPHKAKATNSYCVPVLTYGFGIITWTKKEIESFDVMTRKNLTECNNHHPCSSVEHLYLPCHKAGHGLFNTENLFYQKLALTACHLLSSLDSLVKLCSKSDQSLPPHISIFFLELRVSIHLYKS